MHGQAQINPQQEDSIESIKKLSQVRELRAKEVLMAGKPQLLSEEEFIVPSSNGKDSYKVTHLDSWSCSCLDFKHNCQKLGIYCKHIKALQLFLKLRNNQEVEDFDVLQIAQEEGNCPFCSSENITKQGYRVNKSGKKQKFRCSECKKNFVLDPVKHHKATAKIITLTMDLYFKGLSLRDITDTLKQFYGMNLHHETIRRWIVKFTGKMDKYVETKTPELGKKWHTDEQNVKVGKEWLWSWNTIDEDTKFWIANNITKGRSMEEARKQFKQVKSSVGKQKPEVIITDGLPAYKKAIKKEFKTRKDRVGRPKPNTTEHYHKAGIKKTINNNIVERLHGEIREFDKVRRGFGNVETAEQNLKGMKLYHNFIKKNMSLNGLTPAEASKIDLGLKGNKWLTLLQQSLKESEVNTKKDGDI